MDRTDAVDILIADDDPDDCLLLEEALGECQLAGRAHFTRDGEELLDYLRSCPRLPRLVLLDLNMPLVDGREALRAIKDDPRLRRIPVLVLTTSESPEDVQRSYDCGANAYLSKPTTFSGLVALVRSLRSFWLENAILPPESRPL